MRDSTATQVPQPRRSQSLGAFMYWPDDAFWSFQLLRLIEQVGTGGADFAEVDALARSPTAGDADGRHHGFRGLADRQRTLAVNRAALTASWTPGRSRSATSPTGSRIG